MFLINNEEFTRLNKELEVSNKELEKSKYENKYDNYYIYLEKYVLDRQIKLYEYIINESIYFDNYIISILTNRLKLYKERKENFNIRCFNLN